MTDEKEIQVIGTPDKSIPKFATRAVYTKLKNGDILITFLSQASDDTPASLIETILIDGSHAKNMVKQLDKMLKEDNDV